MSVHGSEADPGAPDPSSKKKRKIRLRQLLLVGALLAGIGLVAVGTAVEISSQPKFCGSCHVMSPYFDSWKQSSHSSVACVECHIAPGMSAEIRKKFEALSMVASYFTGTYGTNPWAEIDDAACLRCHERRLLTGKELFGDVLFDHTAHLAGMRRGKTLRCTSCHSQIVQGSHIAVTTSTCILCHFKEQEAGKGLARCALCHLVPDKEIRHETSTFQHADVGRYGMDCTWCHARPEGNEGNAPAERCLTCHNDPTRLEKYADTDLIHRKHVSEHKVDCTNCHLEIQHVGPPRIQQAATRCEGCHRSRHSPQMNLYAGLGGRGVDPMPDPMFVAGVRCEGCHLEIPGQTTDTSHASEVSCMSCHGPGYRSIFHSWKRGIGSRLALLEGQLAATETALSAKNLSPPALDDARFNLGMVRDGGGVHNVGYAAALLLQSHNDMNAARSEAQLPPLSRPWRQAARDSECLRCHLGIEEQEGTIFGRPFGHDSHLISAGLDCTDCHDPHARGGPDRSSAAEIVRFGEEGCGSCHHRTSSADCTACHADIQARTVQSFLGDFEHADHVGEMELSCDDCHDLSPDRPDAVHEDFCAACHD